MKEMKEMIVALTKAQGELNSVGKNADNPFFRSKYADFNAIVQEFNRVFLPNGFCFSQTNIPSETGLLLLKTELFHSSGCSIAGTISIKPVKGDPQAYGSAMTYAKRYGLSAITGMASEDDDGNGASIGKETRTTYTVPAKHSPPKETSSVSNEESQSSDGEVECTVDEVVERTNKKTGDLFWIIKTNSGEYLTNEKADGKGAKEWEGRELAIKFTKKGNWNIVDDIQYIG